MFTLGFEKVAGPYGKAINRAAKAGKLSPKDVESMRHSAARDITGSRNAWREMRDKGIPATHKVSLLHSARNKQGKLVYAEGKMGALHGRVHSTKSWVGDKRVK